MPNWTYCTLTAPKEVVKRYLSEENGKPVLDFNLVIPMPEILNDYENLKAGGDTSFCIYWYLSDRGKSDVYQVMKQYPYAFERLDKYLLLHDPNYIEKMLSFCKGNSDEYYYRGKKYMEAYKQCKYTNWYDWSIANWGTKWNACECEYSETKDGMATMHFVTAWAYPDPIIRKILEDNRKCYIEFTWFDEDYNGTYTIIRNVSGELIETEKWEHPLKDWDDEEEEDGE